MVCLLGHQTHPDQLVLEANAKKRVTPSMISLAPLLNTDILMKFCMIKNTLGRPLMFQSIRVITILQ